MIDVLRDSWPVVLTLFVLLFGSAFFAASETAVFNLGAADLRQVEDRRVRILKRLSDRRAGLLITVLLGNLLVNIAYFNFGTVIAGRLHRAGLEALAVGLPIVLVLLLILGGEVVPKIAAIHGSKRIALLVGAPLLVIDRLLLVPRAILAALTGVLTRLLLGSRRAEGDLDPAELRSLLEVSASEGHIAPDESERLQGVVALSRTEVREIMVPRVNIIAFPLGDCRERFLDLVALHRRNKIPVYRQSLDRVDGFLDAKEVIAAPGAALETLVKPVLFVPETAPVSQVMERFLRDKVPLMIVVDEYGGTEGLLTHEDLVEAVVGDLTDESDVASPEILHLGPRHFSVDAGMSLGSWASLIGRDVRELGVNTVGGLVTALLGRVPRPKDRVRIGRISLEVVSMKGRRPERVLVRLRMPEEEAA
jgi:putative hemolysin